MVETYIITVNYNGLKFLPEYFESLFSQTYEDFVIVFVDNSLDYDSINYIKNNFNNEINQKKIIIHKNPENYGFAKANNIGIEIALQDTDCKYIVCLNNDTNLEREFLDKLLICAEKHKDAGSIQSKMIWKIKPKLIDSTGLEFSKAGLGFNRGEFELSSKYNKEEEIFGCCAGACLYRMEAIEDVKMGDFFFDEDFFAYYEDFDVAFRLRWAGWSSWYCPEAVVYHHKGGTVEKLSDFTVYHNWRNYTWHLFKELPNQYLLKHFYLVIFMELSQILLSLLRGKWIILRAKLDAYRELGKFLNKKKLVKKRVDFMEIEKLFIQRWRH